MSLEEQVDKHLNKWYSKVRNSPPRISILNRPSYHAVMHYNYFKDRPQLVAPYLQYVDKIYAAISEDLHIALVSPSPYIREFAKLIYANITKSS